MQSLTYEAPQGKARPLAGKWHVKGVSTAPANSSGQRGTTSVTQGPSRAGSADSDRFANFV